MSPAHAHVGFAQDAKYVPNSSTNLITHLQSVHSDLVSMRPTGNMNYQLPPANYSVHVPPAPAKNPVMAQIPPPGPYNPNAVVAPVPGRAHIGVLPPAQPLPVHAAPAKAAPGNRHYIGMPFIHLSIDLRVLLSLSCSFCAVETLHASMADRECSICFGEFEESQVVARLACLCLFHQNCIDGWFAKKGKPACPLHSED
jgi:hypothetical protein